MKILHTRKQLLMFFMPGFLAGILYVNLIAKQYVAQPGICLLYTSIYDTATGETIFDSIIPHMLSTLPDILIGVVVVLVLSAAMSTLSSLVLTSSSTMTLDLLKDHVIKNMSEKKQVVTMQVLIVFFIGISVVLALNPPTFIAQLMGISWGCL